jgi:chromosomal replication initiation ATPase DnaA
MRSDPPTLEALLAKAAAAWGATPEALRDRRRPKLLGPARQAFVLAAVRATANSYRVIGEAMGRDHSSVMTAETTARRREAEDPAFAARVRALCGHRETEDRYAH